MKRTIFPVALLACVLLVSCSHKGVLAEKPLFVDPTYDGAADPFLIQDRDTKTWYMFYTNRRTNVEGLPGVSWVHGTPIGIAASKDGSDWTFVQNADFHGNTSEDATWWAPSLTDDGQQYHMFVTYVPGVFTDWNHPRSILHFTSPDLLHWTEQQVLPLSSERVIDPEIVRMDEGIWRLWYNEEPGGKRIAYADSPDLEHWTDHGVIEGMSRCEGPSVFRWKGCWWMLTDEWHGLRAYRSHDALHWTKLPDCLLAEPGLGADDGVIGGHCDVVVSGDRAYLFYFTHPGRTQGWREDNHATRRSVIQVTELFMAQDSTLFCHRDEPTFLRLSSRGKKH